MTNFHCVSCQQLLTTEVAPGEPLRACRVAGWLHRDEVLDGFGAGRLAVGFMAPLCWLSGEPDEH